MSVESICFHCEHPNSFADKWAGKVMRCQKCGGIITLPRLDTPVAAATAPKPDLAAVVEAHAGTTLFRPATQPLSQPAPRAPEQRQPSSPRPASPLAVTLCIANGMVMLLAAATAVLIALPTTRADLMARLHTPAMSSANPNIAWATAAVAFLLGAFYMLCAARMRRASAFAKAAAAAAMLQTALQIFLLVYMTFHGQLTHISLAVATLSLIALCALIDLATRTVRISPAVAAIG